ncbi:Phosphoadenosine phosphosulfate reductase CysH-type [Choiromyces venosus 120613-1]|uniref:phosphoadenylyl-sulfate reductase (thioredoxin) n=1 Tax=Choiromyces venosus 120613-1 TaxID=1336337 RepID=A0A3N4JCD0_9PEZI|nr:Phosphoadenosine phosphosulfate reductase CysH-type [Choiromyces venosus 120613-1]
MTVAPAEYPQPSIPERSMSQDEESGYDSPGSATSDLPEVYFSRPHLKYLNGQLQTLEPEEILKWCMISLPNLYQTTAFGLTGLVTIDMLSRINAGGPRQIDLIFLDTLYHFDETLELVDKVRERYPNSKLHVYKPDGCANARDFERIHGDNLWDTNDNLYDYLAKVEPAQRAYAELNVKAVLTGRRRSQGGKRGDLDIIEVDDAGLIKVNPLANWTFKQVQEYVTKRNVPYNSLLDMGYKSIGDWHSTSPIAEGEDERSGRWKGTTKTECGIHNHRSKYAEYLLQQEQKKKEEALADALRKVELRRNI